MEWAPGVTEIGKISPSLRKTGGFVAYYRGQVMASSKTLEGLMKQKEVKWLLETQDLLIGHLAPEGMIVVYQNSVHQEANYLWRSM